MRRFNEGSRLTAKSRRLVTPKDGPGASSPEAHSPTATAATETARATAAAVTCPRHQTTDAEPPAGSLEETRRVAQNHLIRLYGVYGEMAVIQGW